MATKEETYRSLLGQIGAMPRMDRKSLLGEVAGMLYGRFGFWWSGFYLSDSLPWVDEVRCAGKDEGPGTGLSKGPWLVLGPNFGPPACEMIRYGRGVCGTAWAERRTVVVPDVDLFPGHIACSSESRSEIVVPVFLGEEAAGVLDIDSRVLSAFDTTDAVWLERICREVARRL